MACKEQEARGGIAVAVRKAMEGSWEGKDGKCGFLLGRRACALGSPVGRGFVREDPTSRVREGGGWMGWCGGDEMVEVDRGGE